MRNPLLFATAVMIWLSSPPVMADPPLTPASLVPCPYTPGEIEAATGLKVSAGEASDMKLPAGRDVGCLYEIAGGSTTFAVRQVWDPSGALGNAQSVESRRRRTKAIPGDPDRAQWTVGKGKDDEPQAELSYTRGKVRTRVLVHGHSFRPADLQPRLLNLRRVP